jgi:hypothetical protein
MQTPSLRYFPTWDAATIEHTLHEWDQTQPGCGALALIPEADQTCVAALQELYTGRRMPLAGGVFPSVIAEREFRTTGLWLLWVP